MDLHLISSLRQAVEDQYRCLSTLRQIVRVVEQAEGETVLEGTVAVFNLIDHPTAEITYAWSDPVPRPDSRRFHSVLHAGPVDSPAKTVRSAIVSE